jgi:hypothetical protein
VEAVTELRRDRRSGACGVECDVGCGVWYDIGCRSERWESGMVGRCRKGSGRFKSAVVKISMKVERETVFSIPTPMTDKLTHSLTQNFITQLQFM